MDAPYRASAPDRAALSVIAISPRVVSWPRASAVSRGPHSNWRPGMTGQGRYDRPECVTDGLQCPGQNCAHSGADSGASSHLGFFTFLKSMFFLRGTVWLRRPDLTIRDPRRLPPALRLLRGNRLRGSLTFLRPLLAKSTHRRSAVPVLRNRRGGVRNRGEHL
jgi:hypothetical protein